uniref:NFACT-R_1 domain-containing protein n=1 Tax=Caenorhabditis tropicalis TaxID=1561998 RepID=A0A1I7U324_9PELO
MKNRFTLVDVIAATTELKKLQGMRVNNVYDIDNKTYLIKLSRTDEKAVILFESGVRLHQTFHDWPKSQTPSSFSMKLRKHINQKRLMSIRVVGFDRLVELVFGSEDRENRLYVELYDRGNVVLTDHELTILNILRVRTDKDTSVRWAVREKYTFNEDSDTRRAGFKVEDLEKAVAGIPDGKEEQLGRIFSQLTKCGNPVTKEILSKCGLKAEQKISKKTDLSGVLEKFEEILKATEEVWETVEEHPKGVISYTEALSPTSAPIQLYQEFNPIPMPLTSKFTKELGSFCESVDEFYSRIETQKQEQKAINMEKQALKKLENVEKDQKERIEALQMTQEQREHMANRIILNQELVEKALLLIRSALANQFSWQTIEEMKKTAAKNGDPVAKSIDSFRFENNEFVMILGDPYDEEAEILKVPIDISMNASKNAQRHFVDKKSAAEKIVTEVKKSRKAMWFEKFRWFISSEGYIVVAGRDAQQNELLVKKYLRPNDIYMHADVRGASSVVIRNKSFEESQEIPPKTLTEAAQMAVCYSNAWEATVTASAWWVRPEQVSRTAPTGEYLPSGSFMIRGKKNFMPPSQLVMGLGVLFRMDEESIERHVAMEKEKKKEEEEVEEKKEEKKEDSEGEEEEFPDVEVKIGGEEEEEVYFIDVGPKNPPNKQQQKNQKEAPEKTTQKYLEEKMKEQMAGPSAKTQKRKQRKEKMVKQKYRDQTEDDLELHRELLKPHGKVEEKKEEEVVKEEVKSEAPKPEEKRPEKVEKKVEEEQEEAEEEDKEASAEEITLLSSLTAQPLDEDTLLFAVPVVAPYSALSTYKYRVKITPGIGKRGKATKSAIELFTRQKTDRQAALIKSLLSDDSASRNLPTKVRISAPQLHKK